VIFCGPPTLLPPGLESAGCAVTGDLDGLIESVDALMALRVQLERQSESHYPTAREYTRLWGITVARAAKMKPSAVILHPGPINRGVELASEVADGPRSRIMNQVEDGIAVRMAILEACA
jgi:aspartate carbamoyltransferase catalytic subunit